MLSDEEKKAIEWFREDLAEEKENCGKYNDYKKQVIKRNEKILNLIKKQSKEIEEYKKQLDLDYVDKHFVPIERYNQLEKEIEELTSALLDSTPDDKIKAKIEEVEQWELYNMKIPRLSTLDERLGAKIGIKYVLQSLLEKE